MKTLTWPLRTACFFTLFLFFSASVWAIDPINQTFFGVAVKGYDVVAYFQQNKPVKGSKKYKQAWNGADWYFTNEENRNLFKANPEKYAPQYGGYCAWAVSQNDTAGIDPDAWKIVEGKLYLNYSMSIQKKWEGDIPGNIKKADQNWPKILNK